MDYVNDYELTCSSKGHVLVLSVLYEHPPTGPATLMVHQDHAILWRGSQWVRLNGFRWPDSFDPRQRLVVAEINALKQVEHLYDATLEQAEGG